MNNRYGEEYSFVSSPEWRVLSDNRCRVGICFFVVMCSMVENFVKTCQKQHPLTVYIRNIELIPHFPFHCRNTPCSQKNGGISVFLGGYLFGCVEINM